MNDNRTYEWDETKSLKNLSERGFGFEIIANADWDHSLEVEQFRDGETRIFALVPIDNRLYAVACTMRGDKIRIISLRKANSREVKRYEES
jgi:uncharacterized DUF497 family protein